MTRSVFSGAVSAPNSSSDYSLGLPRGNAPDDAGPDDGLAGAWRSPAWAADEDGNASVAARAGAASGASFDGSARGLVSAPGSGSGSRSSANAGADASASNGNGNDNDNGNDDRRDDDGLAVRVARVPDDLAGERLDKVLAKIFPEFSRSRLQGWIDEARVRVDGAPARPRQRVLPGATLELAPDLLPEQLAFAPEPVPLDVVYEDETLVVVNKPAGLVVHPAAGNWHGTLLNALLYRYGDAAAGLPRAGIVHRLDKDTSGLMVVARTLGAQTDLVRQLQARTVRRRYLALAWGALPHEGIIDAPIGRDPRVRTRMAVVEGAAGKPARTRFRRVDTTVWRAQPVSALHCDLDTGRTHQIRVHCAHIGHPLLGDPVYGRAHGYAYGYVHGQDGHARGAHTAPPQSARSDLPGGFARQALHAWRLGLIHPRTGRALQWRVDVPADMAALIDALGFDVAGRAGGHGGGDFDEGDDARDAFGGYADEAG